jgi:hypothetical protein
MNRTQVMEQYQAILEEEVHDLAWETKAVQRKSKIDAATLAQMVIFGWWQDPEMRLSGLAQIGGRRDVYVSEAAICQRFTPACADFFLKLLQRLVGVSVHEGEPVETALLKPFSAVIVEDSSTITLPGELASTWRGCGGKEAASLSALKIFTQWNVRTGVVLGPHLTNGRTNDHHSPFAVEDLPVGSLYLADLGFFGIERLSRIARAQGGKRYWVTRLRPHTHLYTRRGHRLDLAGLLPQQVGQVREMGVVLGYRQRLAVRLIVVKVPEEVAQERQERIKWAAQKHGRVPSAEVLKMTHWTILLTNVPRKRATFSQLLVLMRLRWQIERLFRLWKQDGKIDEWRSKKPSRILCECYGKLCAMVIQQPLLAEGCWLDPARSFLKAAAALRRECNRIMVAFFEGNLEATLHSLLRTLHSGCRTEHRGAHPSTSQLLLDGLDWKLELLP